MSQRSGARLGPGRGLCAGDSPAAPRPGRRVLHFEAVQRGRGAAIFPRTQLVPGGAALCSPGRHGSPAPPRASEAAMACARGKPAQVLRASRPPPTPDPDERREAHPVSPRPASGEPPRPKTRGCVELFNSVCVAAGWGEPGGKARQDPHAAATVPQPRPQPKHDAKVLREKRKASNSPHPTPPPPAHTPKFGSRTW